MLSIGVLQSLPDRKQIRDVFIPDDVILNTIANSIAFLSDLIPADVHLYKLLEGNNVKTIAEEKPSIYPSFYRRKHLGHIFPLKTNDLFSLAYQTKRFVEGKKGEIFNGMPMYQIIYPILNKSEKVIGFFMIQRSLYEQRKWGLKQWLYQITVKNIIETILANALVETHTLPPIYPGDGMIIADNQGLINFSNYTAVNTAKNLGLNSPLEGNSFDEVFFNGSWRVIEVNSLFSEQEFNLESYIINIRIIPLDGFILILLRDISELRQKDQEIKIKSLIIREIHHRVKNNLQSITSLLRMQQRRTTNQEVKDILGESIGRISSISAVHDYLSQKSVDMVDLTEMSKNILSEVYKSTFVPEKKINIQFSAPELLLFPAAKAVSVALILNELFNNTFKHAFINLDSGNLSVIMQIETEKLFIQVEDDGVGINSDFESVNNKNLGWKIIRTLVIDDLRGSLEILKKNKGTLVSLKIPYNQE